MKKKLLLALTAFFFATSSLFADEGVKVGNLAPTFTLLDENNREVDIGTLIDRPTIIYFTHNSCFYCTQIILYLKRAEKKYGADHLRILGINIMAKDEKLIKAYKSALDFTYPMFAGNRDDVMKAYRINYVPLIVFIDSRKIVRKVV
ncbi:MAG TPA: TlpA disulfide reductase family protein, partial [Nitrospirota bacterium]|nr:TlpA disulfide reductase family protein [Nitrospirota bacterium]